MEHFATTLFNQVPFFQALGYWPTLAVVMLVCGGLVLGFFGVMSGFYTYLERKLAGWTNARRGPNRVGPFGLLQFLADGVKLILKEDIIPHAADKALFRFAPYLVLLGSALSFVVVPFGPKWIIADLNVGILYLLGTGAFTVVGLIMAGWASNNKWSLLGGIRSAAQIVSYEVPNALAVLLAVLTAGTMSVQGIIEAQKGGVLHWFVFSSPFGFVAFFVYLISAIAEINRIPFDIPEAESELVAGYNIEYSGIRFGAFFAAEFGNIYVISAIAATLFLGGWQVPFMRHVDALPALGRGFGGMLGKTWALVSLLSMAAVLAFIGTRFLRFFVKDLRRKRPFLHSRFVRINTESLLLGAALWVSAAFLALHWAARALLPQIYGQAFFFLLPFLVFFTKCMGISFVVLWLRWTLPRLRVDQLMRVCWKYLTPIGFLCLIGQGLWMCLFADYFLP